jgi:hypothetical protein
MGCGHKHPSLQTRRAIRSFSFGLRASIALVWLLNGLYAKVLGAVPRHKEIVARLFGEDWSLLIITGIGAAEVVMAGWVWSRWRQKLCAVTQILVVMTMNVIEQALTHDLLLWGSMNFGTL